MTAVTRWRNIRFAACRSSTTADAVVAWCRRPISRDTPRHLTSPRSYEKSPSGITGRCTCDDDQAITIHRLTSAKRRVRHVPGTPRVESPLRHGSFYLPYLSHLSYLPRPSPSSHPSHLLPFDLLLEHDNSSSSPPSSAWVYGFICLCAGARVHGDVRDVRSHRREREHRHHSGSARPRHHATPHWRLLRRRAQRDADRPGAPEPLGPGPAFGEVRRVAGARRELARLRCASRGGRSLPNRSVLFRWSCHRRNLAGLKPRCLHPLSRVRVTQSSRCECSTASGKALSARLLIPDSCSWRSQLSASEPPRRRVLGLALTVRPGSGHPRETQAAA
jgi:hypothetical protein